MNIFVTNECPIKAARNLDDRRVAKMALESAQIMSAVAFKLERNLGTPYRPTHVNHPCTVWAASSRANYNWLYRHYVALCEEYYRRLGKRLKCHEHSDVFRVNMRQLPFARKRRTPFVDCSISDYRSVVRAYRHTMRWKWRKDRLTTSHFRNPHPRFTNTKRPSWYHL
jgi:hypothetical protein